MRALILPESNHRDAQLYALAEALGADIQSDDLPRKENYKPDVILACAPRAHNLVAAKRKYDLKPTAICLHQPEEMYAELDAIIAPSYEPLPEDRRVIPTVGVMNRMDASRLEASMVELEREAMLPLKLKLEELYRPYVAVLVGGRHVGGNIGIDDGVALARQLNQQLAVLGGSCLISNSARTEEESYEALLNSLTVPFFTYDYKRRTMPNPFEIFLHLADAVVVTGDSVRMLSQVATIGKPLWIYDSEAISFAYKPLQQQLVAQGAARMLGNDPIQPNGQCRALNEARRVAEILQSTIIHKAAA